VASIHGGQLQVTDRALRIEPYGDPAEGGGRTLADAEAERGGGAGEWRWKGGDDGDA
jgi:hypothetical protein